jgi:hypothetical protein
MDVRLWARLVEPGERVTYAQRDVWASGGRAETGVGIVFTSALAASRDGTVFLAQRRVAPGVFAYEATRISPPVAKILKLLDRHGRPMACQS